MQKIIQSQGGDETASLHFNFIISEVSTMVDGYTELANAIIIQAVKDYRRASTPQMRREIKRFLLSDWFIVLSDADRKRILKRLEQERGAKKYGKRRKNTVNAARRD